MSRVHLLVLVENAFDFFGDPMPAIRDGIIKGTGIEWSINVRARVTLLSGAPVHRSQIGAGGTAIGSAGLVPQRQCALRPAGQSGRRSAAREKSVPDYRRLVSKIFER